MTKTTYIIRCKWVNSNNFYWELLKETKIPKFFGIFTVTKTSTKQYGDLDYAIQMTLKDSDEKITNIIVDKTNL